MGEETSGVSNVGALIIGIGFLGAPYYNYSIMPILIIKASILLCTVMGARFVDSSDLLG